MFAVSKRPSSFTHVLPHSVICRIEGNCGLWSFHYNGQRGPKTEGRKTEENEGKEKKNTELSGEQILKQSTKEKRAKIIERSKQFKKRVHPST